MTTAAHHRAGSFQATGVAILWLFGCVAEAAPATPSAAESLALRGLKGRVSGKVVWESNRTGYWELYVMSVDGSDARPLTHLAQPGEKRAFADYLRPRVSPDGTSVLFAYGKAGAPCEVWTQPMSGGQARKRTVGAPLNWSADGKRIYFVRDSLLWGYDLPDGKEVRVYPTKLPVDGRSGDMVGMVAPDLKSAVFRAPESNQYVTLADGKVGRTMGGCEPRFSADGRSVYWVNGAKDFRRWEIRTGREEPLLGVPPVSPYNYTYFPTVTADGRWLLYGASPGEHSHTSSDYEVYLQELKDWKPTGAPVRLTFDSRTDRWPWLWVEPDNQAGASPRVVAADVTPELPVFLFADANAGPEFGGEWGLWPQRDQCRGTATFVPGDDAEGGPGGALRIDYDIRGAPRTFSVWMTPAGNAVDLSAHDRFVIFAKGTVPSFSLVVKDGNATDPTAPQGIADYPVSGLSDVWQRFDLPFKGFVPRQQGATIDWAGINHVGIALIAPTDTLQGTLLVDNLRASGRALADGRPTAPAGWVAWESNRSGSWQLYKADLAGRQTEQLTAGPGDITRAAVSVDGTQILSTHTLPGKAPAIWIMKADGTEARLLIEDASEGEWRRGGKAIQFLRQPDRARTQWQTWEFDIASGQAKCLFPVPGVTYKPEIWAAVGNDAGERFVAWSPNPVGTWVLSADGRVQTHVHGGCEGQVSPDQRYGFGVKAPGAFVRFNLSDGGGMVPLLDRTGPWSHTYFPCLSRDGRWLVYGACPPDQHAHDSSDYEIFIVGLEGWKAVGEPRRLTHHQRTDRWPAIYVEPVAGVGAVGGRESGPETVAAGSRR